MDILQETAKYTRFIIGGGLGLLLNLAITYTLTEIAGLWFWMSYAIALAANVAFNFYYHIRITFRKTKASINNMLKFGPLTLGITATNYVAVRIFTELIVLKGILPITAQPYYNYVVIIIVTGTLSVINYYANKIWVFK